MSDSFFNTITEKLISAIQGSGLKEVDFELIRESLAFCDIEFGDVSSNIALRLANSAGLSPLQLAQQIVQAIELEDILASAEVAGPGFINLRCQPQFLWSITNSLNETFYKRSLENSRKVNIEFISANPTGPLVLVNAWGGYYGDILARVYASQGWEVEREYYLNDGGNQIAQLGRAIQQAAGASFTEEEAKQLYRGEYIDRLANDLASDFGGHKELIGANPMEIGDKAQAIIFKNLISPTLARLGIQHDTVFSERKLDNQKTIELLAAKGLIIHKDGAVWLDGSKVGLDKDEVLVRSTDNEATYYLKDISYQITKLVDRKFDEAITIVGPDHHGQENRLIAVLKALNVEGFVPLWTQTVRVLRDGKEFKMSKRQGNYIVLDDFLDEVPVDTARFWFAMRDPNSHFDIDLDLIVEQNRNNPLFYVMYAFVRCQSILTKLSDLEHQNLESLNATDEDRKLIQTIMKLDVKITSTLNTYQVHPILHSLVEVSQCFHEWYEKNPVIKSSAEIQSQRIAIVQRTRDVLGGTLKLIGVQPVDRM